MRKIDMIIASRNSWGVQADEHFVLADLHFTCPFCGQFSYFCRGDFARHSASLWYEAVVGFTRVPRGEYIGVAVLCCEKCKKHFGVSLTQDSALFYMKMSPLWQATLPSI